jgi:hypothetical protein
MRQGTVLRNVPELVKSVPAKQSAMNTLTADQVDTLLRVTRDDKYNAAWHLAVMSLRPAEIAALKWDSVDFGTGTLTVVENRVPVSGGSVTGTHEVRTCPDGPARRTARRSTTPIKIKPLQTSLYGFRGLPLCAPPAIDTATSRSTTTRSWRTSGRDTAADNPLVRPVASASIRGITFPACPTTSSPRTSTRRPRDQSVVACIGQVHSSSR